MNFNLSKQGNVSTTRQSTPEAILEKEWWWRHDNNLWSFNPRNHTTKAKANWANVREEDGPIRVSPFVEGGEEQFHSILVVDDWKGPVEWSAHAYELVRRANREQALRGYLDLNLEEQSFLKEALGSSHELSLCMTAELDDSDCAGFSDPVRWNLMEYSDKALMLAFERWLRAQRHARDMPAPRSGKPRMGINPSWRWPEMLDLDYYGLHNHAAFSARVLAQAKARAGQLSTQFWEVLAHEYKPGLRWPGMPQTPEHAMSQAY